MEKSVKSLVMDTIGIIGMFLVAAVLLCVLCRIFWFVHIGGLFRTKANE